MSLLTILNEISKKYGGSEMFFEKQPQKKKFFDDLAHDVNEVIEETELGFKISTFYNLLDTFSNQLKERF